VHPSHRDVGGFSDFHGVLQREGTVVGRRAGPPRLAECHSVMEHSTGVGLHDQDVATLGQVGVGGEELGVDGEKLVLGHGVSIAHLGSRPNRGFGLDAPEAGHPTWHT
jgi:hypothetical protein